MVDDRLFYVLLLLGILWLGGLFYKAWSRHRSAPCPTLRKHCRDPKPFAGLTKKPRCPACEQAHAPGSPAPCIPPPRLSSPHGRPRQVDTSKQFCPQPCCLYYGWLGRGNLRANGYPNGGRWRQFQCLSCKQYFLETQGTPLQGKRVPPEVLVWAITAMAEGLGIRAVARVFGVDPNTVLQWVGEVADQAAAFSRYYLHDVQSTQVQLDELFAVLSTVKAGEVSEKEALPRWSRSPQWVWVALDPVTKLVLALEVGERTLALAQRLVHQVVRTYA
jgi:transposase-like protein